MLAQAVDECPRSKTAIRGLSARAPGHLATPVHRAVQDIHGKVSLHPVTYRVADDTSRAGVLDRTQVELALTCGVLGNVGRPQMINICGGEVLPDEVIVDRWPGTLAVLGPLLSEGSRTIGCPGRSATRSARTSPHLSGRLRQRGIGIRTRGHPGGRRTGRWRGRPHRSRRL